MFTKDPNGKWNFRKIGASDWLEASVPGSLYNDLLNLKQLSDPFYRDNEKVAYPVCNDNYEYKKDFTLTKEVLDHDKVILCCEGLDTICDLYINEQKFASTINMHLKYQFDLKDYLKEGQNILRIVFASPTMYCENTNKERYLWGTYGTTTDGFPHLRKGHYMFGWDWGPKLPDMGVWRNIYLQCFNSAKIDDVYVTQNHSKDNVVLDILLNTSIWSDTGLTADVKITTPDGNTMVYQYERIKAKENLKIKLANPKLWWPNGLGEQPLYNLDITLRNIDTILDTHSLKLGLRTLTIKREKDQWGETFEFNVNGISIFAKGANYIPEDNILSRCNPQKTKKLITTCVQANFNCIRVWGGGIYPEEYFYELCDQYGLIVWQDFMFACAEYELTPEFKESIQLEAAHNIKKFRNHPSLGLFCGNNEMEWAWEIWDFNKREERKKDYIEQFEQILSGLVKEYAPNTFYWPASPSSGGGFDNPNDDSRGDVHYWDVWHGMKPFTEFRKFYFRFLSEFGVVGMSNEKTINSFTSKEDRLLNSYIMDWHQKCSSGASKIMYYIGDYLKYPNDFSNVVYCSQIVQAEALKCGVEFWRQNRGRCMGVIYWQLNDCWPTNSWASIDYFGRWKALQYFAKKFFAPVLLSAHVDDKKVTLHITNDTKESYKGIVKWSLCDSLSNIIKEGSFDIECEPLSAKLCDTLEFNHEISEKNIRNTYFEYNLINEDGSCVTNSSMFSLPKHYEFKDPKIKADVLDDSTSFLIKLQSEAYAKYVELDLTDADCIFGDNYFDLSANTEYIVKIDKSSLSDELSKDQLTQKLKIRSLFDI